MSGEFTHFDKSGQAVMVDVTQKLTTDREAEARCSVEVGALVAPEDLREELITARVVGLQAAKATSSLIPLCHPLPLRSASVNFELQGTTILVAVTTSTSSQTGVEMEALTACGVCALSLVTSLRSRFPRVAMRDLELLRKSGGRSGEWFRPTSNREESH